MFLFPAIFMAWVNLKQTQLQVVQAFRERTGEWKSESLFLSPLCLANKMKIDKINKWIILNSIFHELLEVPSYIHMLCYAFIFLENPN